MVGIYSFYDSQGESPNKLLVEINLEKTFDSFKEARKGMRPSFNHRSTKSTSQESNPITTSFFIS